MNIDFDSSFFSHDTTAVSFEENDGVEQDDDGVTVDWDEQTVVQADEVPPKYQRFFDTDSFYKLDATVARPIPQPYVINDERYTFKKPAHELERSVATLDNTPWVLTHPSSATGAVDSVDDIHGFWNDSSWDGDGENLNSALYFPTNDSDARNFISNYTDVSVGFNHGLVAADEEGIDAYQTGLIYDHVASVKRGRCSGEEGCGFETDSVPNAIIDTSDVENPRVMGQMVADGDSQGCGCGCGGSKKTSDTTMTDGEFDMNWTDRSVKSLRADHSGLDSTLDTKEERISELEEKVSSFDSATEELPEGMSLDEAAETVQALTETLELDDDMSIVDGVEMLHDSAQDFKEELEGYRTDKREELVEFIEENSEMEVDEDDTIEDLEQTKEIIESVSTDTSPTTANPTKDSATKTDSVVQRTGETIDPREFAED